MPAAGRLSAPVGRGARYRGGTGEDDRVITPDHPFRTDADSQFPEGGNALFHWRDIRLKLLGVLIPASDTVRVFEVGNNDTAELQETGLQNLEADSGIKLFPGKVGIGGD